MIQFVNDLNDKYESVSNHILLMDPFPSMSKSYYLVLQIEQQNESKLIYELGVFNIDTKKVESGKKGV